MKSFNLKSGVTLISLIITISLLIILTVVTVGTVKNTKIIDITEEAEADYIIAEEKQKMISAYSKFETDTLINSQISFESLKIEGATVEVIGTFGWKIKYLNTGNVYTMNKYGIEDEAIRIIINAVDELNKEGVDVETSDFIIYEDRVAKHLNKNITNESDKWPEKYIFYNWSTVDRDDIDKIEQRVITSQPENNLICDMSNRVLTIDCDGSGVIDQNDMDVFYEMQGYVSSWTMMVEWNTDLLYDLEINQIYAKYTMQDDWTTEYYPVIFTQDFYTNLYFGEEHAVYSGICKEEEFGRYFVFPEYMSLYPYYNLRSN